jgi:putative endonuclease
MNGYVYMTASQKRGTIYIGVTNDLARRMPEHRDGKGRASPPDTASSGLSGMKSISISAMPSSGRSR